MENDSTSTISPHWPTRWPKGSFSPGWVILLLCVIAGLLFVSLVIFGMWAAVSGEYREFATTANNPAAMSPHVFVLLSLFQVGAEALIVAAILALLPHISRFSLRDIGFRAINGSVLGYAVLGAVAMILIADVGGSIIQHIDPNSVKPQAVEKIFEHMRNHPGDELFFAVFAIVLQPIAEETIFRVFVFNAVLRYAGVRIAALVSGVAFGATHWALGGTDAVSAGLLAVSGMVLCWVYYRSRNAYASMISHGLFNALSTALLYFAPKLAGG